MKKILLTLLVGIFLISFASASITKDNHGVSMNTGGSADNYGWGEVIYIKKGITQLIAFNNSFSSTATTCFALDLKNYSQYTGSLSSHNCSFSNVPTFSNDTEVLLWTGGSGGTGNFNHVQVSASHPYVGTNVDWIRGILHHGGTPENYTNLIFEIENVWTEVAGEISLVTLDVPVNNTMYITSQILFNCTGQSYGSNLINNISLFINGERNYTKENGLTNFSNITIYRNLPNGKYNWTCHISDDSPNLIYAGNYTFSLSDFSENSLLFNTSSYETKYETFKLNISTIGGTLSNVKLNYNGTNYSITPTLVGSDYIFSSSLNIPLITTSGNKSFYFYWNLNDSHYTSSIKGQTINFTIFQLCNSSINNKFLNLTFKDEADNLFINATIPSSTWKYWLGTGSVNKTLSFSNNSLNYEYDFCLNVNESLTTTTNLQYASTDYPQRLFTDTLSLSNITMNKTLFLLGSADGIYVTFQLQNANTEQTISGVNVIGVRDIGGESTIVALGSTDDAGSVTFWLNPDYEHTFNFSKTGYTTFTTSIFPTQTSYTISLTSGVTTTSTDYTKGIYYSIQPKGDYLINNTNFNFNFTLNSSYWDVEQFGFGIYYSNGSIADSTSSTSNGGFISVNVNTLNSTTMRMNFYYIINSTSYNGTRTWYVENGGSSFSILNFFNDLKLYMDSGFFGIDNFGRILICIVIIVGLIGGMVMRYGVNNEAVILGMLFSVVFFLDIGIGLIPPLTFGGNSIPHFVTIALGLLCVGFLIKEEMR